MDSAGLIIFLLFICFIGFIIYASQKDRGSGGDYTPTTPTDPIPKKEELEPPPKKEEQQYISIYEYTSAQNVRRCAYCDGENKYGEKVCCICGSDIDI